MTLFKVEIAFLIAFRYTLKVRGLLHRGFRPTAAQPRHVGGGKGIWPRGESPRSPFARIRVRRPVGILPQISEEFQSLWPELSEDLRTLW